MMWPLLLTSIVALTVVFERLIFVIRERMSRQRGLVERIFNAVEQGELEAAEKAGAGSGDFVARTLTYALEHRDVSYSNALLAAAFSPRFSAA